MSQLIDVDLTLDEKNSILDKILGYKNRNGLKNIHTLVISGIPHYLASFVDHDGTKIEFFCSSYRDNSPRYGRFGLPMVDIGITWGIYGTAFDSASGSTAEKIRELIDYLKPICDGPGEKGRDLLLR